MALTFRHFDTRLNQWIHTDGNKSNPNSVLTEKPLENTLLEALLRKTYPDIKFTIGHADEHAQVQDLKQHPEGQVLLLSSKSRLVYGPPECLETIDKIFPDRKDRGAYGSVLLGGCSEAFYEELNILIVDDSTGANGGIINDKLAYELTGDCYGQISPQVYDRLAKPGNLDTPQEYKIIQHRFGWTPEDGNDPHFRFGKGTFRPKDLTKIGERAGQKIDLILPLSSFKGTDKDNPSSSGPQKPQIKPGLHKQRVWVGNKSESQQGKTAISQLLASFPSGVKDFVEELESEAMRLQQVQNDPRKVAELYCERYEKQKNFSEQAKANTETVTEDNKNGTTVNITDEEPNEDDEQNDKGGIAERDDLIMYKLIKADLMGHHQILETEKVKQELSRFMQKQWSNVALGKTITFDRAMIIPSKELKNGEICVPWMENGEEIINFRSPFLNSNGACVSVNRHIQDMEGPDGKKLKGVIIVNDEDFNRIFNRINSQVQNTVAILKEQNIDISGFQEYLNQDVNKLEESEKYAFIDNFNEQIKGLQNQGYNIELIPKESESARQGRDFDGDCIGVIQARQYPNLTAEIKYRNLPENAYEPTVKLKKVSFYNADGSQPEFEQIALQMSDGISVGIINNQVTSLTALESEIEIIRNSGNQQQKSDYINAVAEHYKKLFSRENNERKPEPIDEQYRDGMLEIIRLASVSNRTPEIVARAMEANRLLYRKMLEEASKQNQVAVDMFKSARLPDIKAIETIRSYLYRVPTYIKEKKSQAAYLSTGIKTNGVSPVELLINQTNSYFKEAVLESRPMQQFQDLFQGVPFTNQDKLKNDAKRKEYETIHSQATALDKRRKIERGPYVITKTAEGKELQITNLTKFNHPRIWQGKTLNIEFQETDREKRTADKPHRFIAVAQIDGEMENGEPLFLPLGTVDVQSANNLNLRNGSKVQATVVELMPELTKSQTQVMFQQATEIAGQFRQSIPEDQLLANAAACWAQSTIRENTTTEASKVKFESNETKRKSSSFFYATYGNELVGQLAERQLKTLEVSRLGSEKNHFQGRSWNPEEKHDIQIGTTSYIDSNGSVQNKRNILVRDETGSYKEFSTFSEESAKLPIGATASGSVAMLPSATANVTFEVNGGTPITVKVGKIKNCDFANHTFENENLTVEIKPIKIANANKVFIRIGDKTLGRLSKESAEEIQKVTPLNDKTITLKLTSQVDEGEGAYIIGVTRYGNQVRIEGINQHDFALKNFPGKESTKCDLYVADFSTEMGLAVDGKRIGVVTFKKDQEALKQAGLMGNVKGIITDDNRPKVNCTINSNFTVANIKIDPESVKEPEVWTTEAQAFKETTSSTITQIDEGIAQAKPFLEALTRRPNIYFQSSEMKDAGVLGMAVDNHQVEVYRKKLQEKNVEFTQLPPEQVPQETQKGLVVFNVKTDSMAPGAYENLQKSGIVLDSTPQVSPVPSQYQQAINQIINRPTEIANDPQRIYPASAPKVVIQQNVSPSLTAQTVTVNQQNTNSAPTATPQKRVISATAPVQKPNVQSLTGKDNKNSLTPSATTEVILNDEQKNALEKLLAFARQPLDTKNNEFLLTGYAGTGKTFLIQQLLKELRTSGEEPKIIFTAPTNSAVKVLKDMANAQNLESVSCSTTHSLLKLRENYNEISGQKTYEKDNKKGEADIPVGSIIVVDESSMLSKSLYKEVQKAAQQGAKVIYMGDRGQLPPINEEESLAFSVKNSANLTKVVRYEGDIVSVTEEIRNNIEREEPTPIRTTSDNTIVAVNEQEFKDKIVDLFTSPEFRADNSSVKVIAYTNNRVDEINKFIKENLFGENSPEYLTGLRIIARDPVIGKTEGKPDTVLFTSGEMTVTGAQLNQKGDFKIWKLEGITEEGKFVEFETVADESKKDYEKYAEKIKANILKLPPDQRKWKDYYNEKEKYANVRPAYSITTHNSQGKTIKKGVVDKNNLDIRLTMALKEANPEKKLVMVKEYNKLVYVAMTRFKEQVFVLSHEREKEIDNLRLIAAKQKLEDLQQNQLPINQENLVSPQTVTPFNKKIIPTPAKNNQFQQTAPPSNQAQDTPTDIILLSSGDSAKRFIPLGYRKLVESIKSSLIEIERARAVGNIDWETEARSFLAEDEFSINDSDKFRKLTDIAKEIIDAEKVEQSLFSDKQPTEPVKQVDTIQNSQKVAPPVKLENNIPSSLPTPPVTTFPTNDNPQPIAVSPVVIEAPIDSPIKLPSARAADKTVPIEVMGQISPDKVQQILEHLETHIKPLLRQDMSQYAPGRQVAWVSAEWGLKDKTFLPGVEDKTLQNLMQQVYPGSTMMLISYSENEGNGINYHRDDSYAAIEARTINLGPSDWGFRATNEQMSWTKDQNDAAPYQQFNLEPGAVIRFNCKDEHAAINPSAGRWSINIWEVKNDLGRENSVREKFNQHLESLPTPTAIVNATPPITITTNDWQPGGSIKPHALTYNVIHSKQEVSDATYNQKYLPVIKSAVEKGIEVKLANDTGVNGRIIGTLEELGYTVSSQTITQSTKDGERKRTAWSGVPKQELKIEVTPQIPNAQAPSTPTPTPTTPIPTTPTPFAQPSPTPTIQTELIPTLASLPISAAPAVPVALQNVQPTPPLASPPSISEHTPTRQNPETPIISGKPIAMSYGLIMYGDRNELPVNSTIEAMRGHGRTHTTRQYEPYKAYGFKEGDIAIAKDGNTQVAFRVGKQYQILPEQIADPKFQASWAAIEKHSAKALPELFNKKTEIWGLHMEPLGDYVNGKIVPFPDIASIKQTTSLTSPPTPVKEGVNIGATSNNPLGAALSNATVSAKENGKITSEYPVSFGDNAAVPAGKYGPETYPVDKPAGVPYVSAEQAFQAEKHKTPSREQRVEMMTQILQAKLEQHPKLAEGIKAKGGVEWLENSTHYVTYAKDSYWEGKGKDSPFVRALIDAYSKVLESQITTDSAPTPVVATIAVPNAPDSSSPPDPKDLPKQTPDSTLVSLPTADIQPDSVFTGSAASKYEETTLQNIRNWYVTCVAIGKPQAYLDRIQEVGKDFKAGGALSDAASIAMNKDQEQIRPINKLIQIGERLGETQRTINAIERNDFRPVQDFIAKGYNFSLKKDSKDFSIHTSEGTPVLVLSNGVIKANNITPEISQNFEKINQNLTKDIETLKKGLSSVDRIVM